MNHNDAADIQALCGTFNRILPNAIAMISLVKQDPNGANGMVGSYTSLSVCLDVCHSTEYQTGPKFINLTI